LIYQTTGVKFASRLTAEMPPDMKAAFYGLCVAFAGEPALAVEVLQANLRLDPFQNATRLGYFGHAFYLLKRYDEAVPPLRESDAVSYSKAPHPHPPLSANLLLSFTMKSTSCWVPGTVGSPGYASCFFGFQ
jgi:hypothetical protein